MRNADIDKQAALRRERLDPHHYTISLLQEGNRVGLMDQGTIEDIQVQLMNILADLIIRYNGGESTSLKTETAQRIMLSILYSIDAYTRSLNDPEEAISLLMTSQLKEIYDKGMVLVASSLEKSKRLYEENLEKKLDVPIQAYNSTLDALPEFFNHYDLVFSAQDTMADIDYPLLFDDMQIEGIFYIEQYLAKLELETSFCRLFAIEDVKKLLFNYGRVYRINYREALINVFEIVLSNSIFSVLSGSKATSICLSRPQYNRIKGELAGVNQIQCRTIISQAVQDLMLELGIDQPEWKNYIHRFIPLFLPRFLSALDSNCLDNVMILDHEEKRPLDILLDAGKTMDDESFRSLIDQILTCSDREQKAAIIASSTHSTGDFIDVLEADCLFGDEYHALFSILGDMELSLLARMVFVDEIRADPDGFSLEKGLITPVGDEQWQSEYIRFLSGLSPKRLESIDQYIHASIQVADTRG